jgi:predicted RNA-binding Zn-ribbon protein involved in translation (DUF1610 family)
MSSAEQPPVMDGVEWEEFVCPGCGNTWWLGGEIGGEIETAGSFEMSSTAWAELLGRCADCRDEPNEGVKVHNNRAARRAARHRKSE